MVYVITRPACGTFCAISLTQDGALAWIEECVAMFGDAKTDFRIDAWKPV